MDRGAFGSELDGNPAEQRAIWSREDPRFSGPRLHPSSTIILHCGMLILKCILVLL